MGWWPWSNPLSDGLLAARVERERAEAAAITKRADAGAAEAAARTAEITMRADREAAEAAARTAEITMRAHAEAAEAMARAKALADATHADNVRKYAPLFAVGALCTLLCADFVAHDVRSVQRWRMLRKLRALRLPPTASAVPRAPLPMGVAGLRVGPKPTMLLGPSGSGKSMRLAQTARDALSPPEGSNIPASPVAYIRMRPPMTGTDGGSSNIIISSSNSATDASNGGVSAAANDADASARLEATARLVFEQLGYPSRPSLVSMIGPQLRRVTWLEWERQLYRGQVQRNRFVDALRMLFDVAERLYIERKAAGIPEEHAPIVLLFDEVQGLTMDYSLARVGGRFVFEELAALLVAYGVDRRAVRSAVAGSPAHLAVEFDKTIAHGARWEYIQMSDPSPETIVAALTAKGYTEDEARRMIDLVGTRLRLLEAPLEKGAAECSCFEFLRTAHDWGVRSFTSLLGEPTAERDGAQGRLVDILQRIVSHEAGQGDPPKWYHMPESLRAQQFSKVLYLRLDDSFTFQSQLHRTVWRELSKDYAR
jgi:hypothetical protein